MTKEWPGYKLILRQLYIKEARSLEEVMRIMKSKHGFIASQRTYRSQFKKWGWYKYEKNKAKHSKLRGRKGSCSGDEDDAAPNSESDRSASPPTRAQAIQAIPYDQSMPANSEELLDPAPASGILVSNNQVPGVPYQEYDSERGHFRSHAVFQLPHRSRRAESSNDQGDITTRSEHWPVEPAASFKYAHENQSPAYDGVCDAVSAEGVDPSFISNARNLDLGGPYKAHRSRRRPSRPREHMSPGESTHQTPYDPTYSDYQEHPAPQVYGRPADPNVKYEDRPGQADPVHSVCNVPGAFNVGGSRSYHQTSRATQDRVTLPMQGQAARRSATFPLPRQDQTTPDYWEPLWDEGDSDVLGPYGPGDAAAATAITDSGAIPGYTSQCYYNNPPWTGQAQ
ncbi:uncharacterized protein MKZ38_004919 [Zalerion maritima]|uniref:Clr5 domain-containing protein n=1 Tax=Zalerion maritima TaxID=339359 RepID=A0AAD5RYD5_9PEZI|nr:uncharacterized protein MKZ38_004919 [Zalerion maritima]